MIGGESALCCGGGNIANPGGGGRWDSRAVASEPGKAAGEDTEGPSDATAVIS